MEKSKKHRIAREKRHQRVRRKVFGTSVRPRLSVYRSNKNIYAQLIDDVKQVTLTSASTICKEYKQEVDEKVNKTEQSKIVGKIIAKKAKDKGIEKVVFDRGGYLYHGRVKALAEAAREEGLKF